MTEHLEEYKGDFPAPKDFWEFWQKRMKEADRITSSFYMEKAKIPSFQKCEFYDFWYYGIHGERLYAKVILPTCTTPPPVILQFHGYPGASRSFLELASFAALGFAVVSPDCPGQGGLGEDTGGYVGTTVTGHLVAGLDGEVQDMYYVRLYQNFRILSNLLTKVPAIDGRQVFVNGASQGGGIGTAFCALNPDRVKKAAILYPFLSDFSKVWDLGADEIAYEGLRYYSRWFDPDGRKSKEMFRKLSYIDTKNFAPYVTCEVLFGTGLADTVCPVVTQTAVYNNLKCKKRRIFFEGFGHEEIQDFDDLLDAYFRED